MDQLENVLLALDKAHIVFEEGGCWTADEGKKRLNQVMVPTAPMVSG